MSINDGIGGAGTGNFSLLPIRITDPSSGLATDASIIQGINLAAQNGCRVITISYSATSYTAVNNAVSARSLPINRRIARIFSFSWRVAMATPIAPSALSIR